MISKLTARLTDLKVAAETFPKSLENTGTAVTWDKLSDDPELSDHQAVRDTFDREEAATAYKEAVDKPDEPYGTREAQAAKIQNDILSSLQQGFVMRNRTRLQMMADAASLRKIIGKAKIELVHERQVANIESAQ